MYEGRGTTAFGSETHGSPAQAWDADETGRFDLHEQSEHAESWNDFLSAEATAKQQAMAAIAVEAQPAPAEAISDEERLSPEAFRRMTKMLKSFRDDAIVNGIQK